MKSRDEYRISLEVFEGPLDLLLYLIRRDELDIYDIPVDRVADQYMEYINAMKVLDLDIAGDFLVMASTLLMIKSRLLLPDIEAEEGDGEELDPRLDLVRQLLEYKQFKDVALELELRELAQEDIYIRDSTDGVELGEETTSPIHELNLFDLLGAFNDALKKVPQEDLREIFAETYTVTEKIGVIQQRLKSGGVLNFKTLFSSMASRMEIVCTFMALLELIRLGELRAVQQGSFGDIELQDSRGLQ